MAGRDVLPRARRKGLVIRELPDETLVYDLERHKAHCLNQTAALIWNHCDGQTSMAEITEKLESADSDLVRYAIAQFERRHLLEEPMTRRENFRQLTRRDVLRKTGLAAAVALPVIITILAPTAYAQGSCAPQGFSPCTPTTNCCSGVGNCNPGGHCK